MCVRRGSTPDSASAGAREQSASSRRVSSCSLRCSGCSAFRCRSARAASARAPCSPRTHASPPESKARLLQDLQDANLLPGELQHGGCALLQAAPEYVLDDVAVRAGDAAVTVGERGERSLASGALRETVVELHRQPEAPRERIDRLDATGIRARADARDAVARESRERFGLASAARVERSVGIVPLPRVAIARRSVPEQDDAQGSPRSSSMSRSYESRCAASPGGSQRSSSTSSLGANSPLKGCI